MKKKLKVYFVPNVFFAFVHSGYSQVTTSGIIGENSNHNYLQSSEFAE